MITIIYSSEPLQTKTRAKSLVKKSIPQRDETNYISFNMTVTTPGELACECELLPLGTEKKAIVADNCTFLEKPVRGKAKPSYEGLDALEAFCKNPADFTDLYMLVYAEKLDEKNPIVMAVKANGKIIEERKPDEAYFRSAMEGFLQKRGISIEPVAADELLRRVGDDFGRFSNELRKLEIYANGEDIRLAAVKMLVAPKLEDDAFTMSNALVNNDVKKAFKVYRDLQVANVDEVMLIGMLASQFRFMDEVAFLDEKGFSSRQIASTLGANPYRVSKTLQSMYSVDSETIANILNELYIADKAILTGSASPEFAFSRFLANFSLRG